MLDSVTIRLTGALAQLAYSTSKLGVRLVSEAACDTDRHHDVIWS